MKKPYRYLVSGLVLTGLLTVTPLVQKSLDQAGRVAVQTPQSKANQELFERSEKAYRDQFYYQQLTKEERIEYGRFVESLRQFEEKTDFQLTDDYALSRVYLAVSYDFPEFFWLSESPEIDFSQNRYPDGVQATYQRLQEIANQIVAQLPEGSDYDKVKFIYEYVIQHTQYNKAALTDTDLAFKNQSIRSVFLEQVSVCAGYSRAFQLLCQKAGIKSLYVVGDITAYEEPHAWNLVKIDGKYYPVDTTWGDPNFEESVTSHQVSGINYAYLCMPQALFDETHRPWLGFYDASTRELNFPKFSNSDLNYFVLTGTYLETYQPDQVGELVFQHLSNPETASVSLQFASAEVYDEALTAINQPDNPLHPYLIGLPNYQGFELQADRYSHVITLKLMG